MEFTLDPTTAQYALGASALLLGGILFLKPNGLVQWLQRKNYQYEVTFALYMLTPTEKFIFNSIMFLACSMFLIASTLYLPNHLLTMARRAYYYCAGDAPLFLSSRQAAETLLGTASGTREAVLDAAGGWAHLAYQAAMNRTATAAVTSD